MNLTLAPASATNAPRYSRRVTSSQSPVRIAAAILASAGAGERESVVGFLFARFGNDADHADGRTCARAAREADRTAAARLADRTAVEEIEVGRELLAGV